MIDPILMNSLLPPDTADNLLRLSEMSKSEIKSAGLLEVLLDDFPEY